MALSKTQTESLEDEDSDPITKLSREERIEIASLIANVTSVMRKQLSDLFELPIVRENKAQQQENFTKKEIQNEAETIVAELRDHKPSTSIIGIEQEALQFFDKWRDTIVSRVKEVFKPPEDISGYRAAKSLNEDATHTSSLNQYFETKVIVKEETEVAKGLLEEAINLSGSDEVELRSRSNNLSHICKLGLAGVAGATVIGITGGLATPLVAGAVGTIMGGLGLGATTISGLLGAIAQSSIIIGGLFGAYGAKMTSKAIDSYAKEVNDFKFISLNSFKGQENMLENRRLRVTITVSGWLTQEEDLINPWCVLGRENEVFPLRWELEALRELGNSMNSLVNSTAWKVAKKEIIARTIFSSLMQALWPLSILKVSKIIDNPFSICMNRADKAGIILADAIINKSQGERPVTLIGYSLGARLIYSCLISLAERHIFGLIESVVLMGAPIPSTEAIWRPMRSVVSGRLVNVYSTNDYILAFLYRTWSVQYGVAGIQEIKGQTRK